MVRVAPVSLRFVAPEWVDEVPAPPHDALTAEARRRHLRDHPRSYLGVTRSPDEIDLDALAARGLRFAGATEAAIELSRHSMEELLAEPVFQPARPPALYRYRLSHGHHRQTALLCGVATADYDEGRIRIHEQINHRRADLLAGHLRRVGAQSSPIALAFRSAPPLERLLDEPRDRPGAVDRGIDQEVEPLVDLEVNGFRHTVWPIDDPGDRAAAVAALADEPLYLIDGHHRAAAASADRNRHGPDDHLLLAAVFPLQQLRNGAFHRLLTGVDPGDVLDRLADRFPVRIGVTEDEVIGRAPGRVAVATGPSPVRWSLVELPPPTPTLTTTPVLDIEPVRLGQHVLAPLFGIEEPIADPRLSYRPGPLAAPAAAGLDLAADQVEFRMRPVPLTDLADLADRGQVMPPKSTYFTPKVRSGLFVRLTDPTLG